MNTIVGKDMRGLTYRLLERHYQSELDIPQDVRCPTLFSLLSIRQVSER
jgi:hypothetical protein